MTRRPYQQTVPTRPALLSRRRRQRPSDDIRWSTALILGIVALCYGVAVLYLIALLIPVPAAPR